MNFLAGPVTQLLEALTHLEGLPVRLFVAAMQTVSFVSRFHCTRMHPLDSRGLVLSRP